MHDPAPSLRDAALVATLAALLPACSMAPSTAPPVRVADPLPLAIAKLDHAMFDALNGCADEEQLDAYEDYLAKDIEVYHGLDGLRVGRKAQLAYAEESFCGKQRRELIDSSIKVHPIAGYGAIETGRQRFCSADGKACEPATEFAFVWHKDGKRWRLARVLSYGQQPKG